MAETRTDARNAENTAGNNRKNDSATKTRKGFWARYTDRLKNTRCTLTPPECR